FSLSLRLGMIVALVSVLGVGAGAVGLLFGHSSDYIGLLAVLTLVGAGQALSYEAVELEGSLSVIVVWSARRNSLHHVAYNIGTMAASSLAAAAVFSIWPHTTSNVDRGVVAVL